METQSGYDIIVTPRVGTNLDTKRWDAMRNEGDWSYKDYSYYSYGISIIKLAFLVGLILGLLVVFTGVGKAEDNKTIPIDFDKVGWPTQLIYDSANGCFQGTHRWIVMINPALAGLVPPPRVRRVMIEHCFCVLDKARKQYTFTEYIKRFPSTERLGTFYTSLALTCVKEEGTLQGLMILEESKTDNSTIIPEKPEAPTESLPDQAAEEPSSEPETIFQG